MRALPPTAQAPPESQISVYGAVHDAELSDAAKCFQPRAPYTVLKRCLRHGRHSSPYQQVKHIKEGRQRPHRQFIAGRCGESRAGVGHAFLDLVTADRWTPHPRGDLVGEGRLA
jgi:hypothetical protein